MSYSGSGSNHTATSLKRLRRLKSRFSRYIPAGASPQRRGYDAGDTPGSRFEYAERVTRGPEGNRAAFGHERTG